MKPSPSKSRAIVVILLALWLACAVAAVLLIVALFTGCANLPNIRASEMHRTTSYPLIFTHQIDATDISKVTTDDGRVVRRAKSLTSVLTAGGYSSSTVFKDAELEELQPAQASPAPASK